MIEKIVNNIKLLLKKIELSKVNYLNHKFKKYIVKYEEKGNKIKIINSTGSVRYVDNNISNKVKLLEIIKDHEKEIDNKIKYYDNNKEDYKVIIMSSALLLIVLGGTFLLSFFIGSYLLFILVFLSFSISLVFFSINIYNTILFREEIKRLKYIKNDKIVLDDNEVLYLFKDGFKYLKKYFYEIVLKTINLFDSIKIKLVKKY